MQCDYFFALLSGELSISRKQEYLTSIAQVCSFGTIGYFTGKRSAEVIAAADSVVLKINRQTIQGWPDDIQSTLHENLARELSRIVESMNNVITNETNHCFDRIHDVQEKLCKIGI